MKRGTPMSNSTARKRAERITSLRDGHWLLFDNARKITGCYCGMEADVDSDCGWGDSVVDHIYKAGFTDGASS